MESQITSEQVKRLQTLWGLIWTRFALGDGQADRRETRLGWVAGKIGRPIGSFKNLSQAEAKLAIDAMEGCLPAEAVQHRRPGRDRARAYGTAGRKKGRGGKEISLPDVATFALLDGLLGHLGWDRARLDAFLRSPKSPVRGGIIRTLADANRVIWILKAMLRRSRQKESQSVQTEHPQVPGVVA